MNHVPRNSLHIPKDRGEEAVVALKKLQLLDSGVKIKIVNDAIVLPLRRIPETIELENLKQMLGKFNMVEDKFLPRLPRPKSLSQVLASILPEPEEHLPVSFDIVGDIAILDNDPKTKLLAKSIAEGIMEVHPNVHSVFLKTGPIAGPDRIIPLRYLAGENRTITTHRESGCLFRVDISKVFFSPRLSNEHMKIARQVRDGEHVLDMFAGIGPFSILVAKSKDQVRVESIDANPEATKFILENAKLNKIEGKIRIWIGDANKIVPEHLAGTCTRVIMNHPSESRNFISSACTALSNGIGILNYYTFAHGADSNAIATNELATGVTAAGAKVMKIFDIRKVRETAPFTWQIAVDAEVGRSH